MGGHDALSKCKALFWAGHDLLFAFNEFLAARFGTATALAADWVLLGLALVVLLRLFKFTYDVLRYVLIPSVIIAGLVAAVSPISFMYVMQLAMGAGTLFLLFKG